METPSNIAALIQLIDDPDENIYLHVRDKLMNYGPDAIPLLESSWEEKDFGLIFMNRVENIIHDIQFDYVKQELRNWLDSDRDLLQGAITIAKYQYSGLDEDEVYTAIESIRKDVWLELSNKQTAFEKIKVFNKIFFGKHSFHGDSKNFHSPLNSYINIVLESRKGNPLSLSIIYSIIAQSLQIPIYGVNLPNHFVLAYMDEDGISQFLGTENTYGVLFYINAFSKGGLFDEAEVKKFLKGINISPKRSYFEPCSNSAILRRMLTNLITSFQQVGNAEKVKELTELRDILE